MSIKNFFAKLVLDILNILDATFLFFNNGVN